jgi:predicted ester cyclase/uncharacterized protein YndB with AHSA1/START domain
MPEIDVRASTAAPPEQVWALLADVRTWPGWAGFDEAAVETGSGVGEVRRFRLGRRTSRERVTVLEAPHRFAYELLSGLPIRDYRAEVTLEPRRGGGTEIRWRSSFEPQVPGTGGVIRTRLEGFIARAARALATVADAPHVRDDGDGRRDGATERNKDVVARLTRELFNDGGDLAVAEDLLAEDFVDHTPAAGSSGDRASYQQRARVMRGPFSGIRTVSDQLVADGDLVFERWTCTFTHTGEFMGINPTGRTVRMLGFAQYRLRDGRVTEFWGLSDALSLMEQLGALSR